MPKSHTMNRRRCRRAGCLAVFAMLLVAVAPAHAELLREPETLSPPRAGNPFVAMTPSGHTLVVWSADGQIGPSPSRRSTFVGAWRSPGGTFGEPFVVARDRAVIDIVATGDEGVVISGQDSRGSVVTLLAAGSHAGIDQVLSSEQPPPGLFSAGSPLLAADGHGNAIATVLRPDGSLIAFSRGRRGLFGTGQTIAGHGHRFAAPAMNSAGDAAIVMAHAWGGQMVSVRRAGEAAFGAAEDTGIRGFGFSAPEIGVTPNGDVATVGSVIGPSDAAEFYAPNFAFRPVGGRFSPQPVRLAGGSFRLVTGDGSTVSIVDLTPAGAAPRVTDRRPDGSFAAPLPFGHGPVCDPLVAARTTSLGNTTMIYRFPCQAGPVTGSEIAGSLELVERPAGGGPTRPVKLGAPDAGLPAIASNRTGSVAIAWITMLRKPSLRRVQVVVRDGPVELALQQLGRKLPVSQGRAKLRLACTGLRDCRGSVKLQRLGARGPRSRVRVGITVRRGHRRTKRVPIPRSVLGGKRARLRITVTVAKGKGVRQTRSRVVTAKRR